MQDTVIESGAVVRYSIIDENTVVGAKAKVGEPKESGKGIALIGREIEIGEGVTVEGGAIVDKSIVKGDN